MLKLLHLIQMSSIDDSVKMDVRMVEAGEEGQELPQRVLDPTYLADKDLCLSRFDEWTKEEQSDFIENLLRRISEDQQAQVGEFVTPLLRRDFVTLFPKKGLDHIAENILSYLDVKSLCVAKLVCKDWNGVISNAMLWKKLIERHVRTDLLWRGLGERRGWYVQFQSWLCIVIKGLSI
ncbi:F-box/WD repeat-containing protein 11, partial [Orchesella cincta]